MKNDETGKWQKPPSIPVKCIQSELIAAAKAGMLNDWKTDSLRFGALGEHPRRPQSGRRGASPPYGEE
jgi:hypothetical protein